MSEKSPLHCLVCGYERGGTTLVGELIRQHPQMDGRFEGGLLLAENSADFATLEPYVSNIKRFWHLDDDDIAYLCGAESWMDAYRRLRECSDLPDKNVSLYDKTPAYMLRLSEVLEKIDVPAVCVVRDPRALYWSHWKHAMESKNEQSAKPPVRDWARYYLRYANGLHQAQKQFLHRILVVQMEELVTAPERVGRQIYDFLGLEFRPEYTGLPDTDNPYVSRGGIVSNVIYEYLQHLSKIDQFLLRFYTRSCVEWHWK